jgi:hypothetical protein
LSQRLRHALSPEGAAVIRDLIRVRALILAPRLETVGAPPDAYLAEKVENAAEIAFKLLLLGREPLPCDALANLLDKRERMGLMRPGERAIIEQACG